MWGGDLGLSWVPWLWSGFDFARFAWLLGFCLIVCCLCVICCLCGRLCLVWLFGFNLLFVLLDCLDLCAMVVLGVVLRWWFVC